MDSFLLVGKRLQPSGKAALKRTHSTPESNPHRLLSPAMAGFIGHDHNGQTDIRSKREGTDVPRLSIALLPRKQSSSSGVSRDGYFKVSVSTIFAFNDVAVHQNGHRKRRPDFSIQ